MAANSSLPPGDLPSPAATIHTFTSFLHPPYGLMVAALSDHYHEQTLLPMKSLLTGANPFTTYRRNFMEFTRWLVIACAFTTMPAIAEDYRSVVLADNPVGYWRLNETPGSSVVADSSTSQLSGVSHNVLYGFSGPPHSTPNTASFFNGSTSYIEIPDNPALHVQAFTIEAWVFVPENWTSPGGLTNCVYGQQRSLNETGINFGIGSFDVSVNSPRVYLGLNDGTDQAGSNIAVVSETEVVKGQWSHIAGTYDGNRYLRVYLNGTLARELDWFKRMELEDRIYNGNNPYIGREFDGPDSSSGNRSYPGGLAEVAVYNYALTDPVIRCHYNSVFWPVLGDFNNDGILNNQDIRQFVLALTDPDIYALAYPTVNLLSVGDLNGDMEFDNQDIAPFVSLLTAGGTVLSTGDITVLNSIPEPATLGFLAIGGLIVLGQHRFRSDLMR